MEKYNSQLINKQNEEIKIKKRTNAYVTYPLGRMYQ